MYEEAEKFTTPAYRAPELYDKGLDQDVLHVDESIDVWALGCVLYAMAYLENPFDSTVLRGGNLKLAVLSGQITFPPQPKYDCHCLYKVATK
jgi:serine/threonine kinase 16